MSGIFIYADKPALCGELISLAKELGLPCGVVVNRSGEDLVGLHRYCQSENLPILLSLPDDRQIAEVTSRGDLISHQLPEYGLLFSDLATKLKQELQRSGVRS